MLILGNFILGVGKVILNIFFIAFIPLLIALFAFSIPLLNLLTTLFKTLLTIFSTDLKSPLNIEVIKDIDVLTILLIEFNFDVNKLNIEDKIFSNSVVTVHHDLNDSDRWLNINSFLEKYKKVNRIICLNSIQKKILKQYGIDNTIVIPHGYQDRIFIPSLKRIENRKLRILICSKHYDRRVKGEGYLIELLKFVDNRILEFILVGESRSKDIELFKKFGFNIEIYEYLPYRIFGELYKNIDFLLMCSYYEGGPANIPEAIASGTPIICNPIGIAFDMVTDGYNGIHLSMNAYNDSIKLNNLFNNKDECNRYFINAMDKNIW